MPKKYNYITKTGRPTKYIPAVINPKIEEYLSMCGREQTMLPTIEGLADYLNVTSETIRQWAKENKEFSSAIKRITDRQKTQLMNDGMYGGKEVNAGMAIFLLKVNHGMRENDPSISIFGDKVIAILGGTTNALPSNNSDK